MKASVYQTVYTSENRSGILFLGKQDVNGGEVLRGIKVSFVWIREN